MSKVENQARKNISKQVQTALDNYNNSNNTEWDFGSNWSSVGTEFEKFTLNYLFPKINESDLVNVDLGNRFDWLAKEVDFYGQYSEEYVILDSVPVNLNLSKEAELMLQRNYPKIATKIYKEPIIKKVKFTLNNNDNRLAFANLGDAISYALAVYRKAISDINVYEEKTIKAMLVDYALNVTRDQREVQSLEDLYNEVYKAMLNIQNNSDEYNESTLASGGALGRYTTKTDIQNVAILTTDTIKTYLLNTQLANTFQVAGLDITDRIISFDNLGGVYRTTEDIKITTNDTLEFFRIYGDYQIDKNELIPEGSVLTFDVSELKEFKDKVVEVKPESDLFAYVFDINKLKYRRTTSGMLKKPHYNGEFDEVTHWIHYPSFKSMSPFFNSVTIGG